MKLLWLSHNVPYPPVGGVLQRNYHLLKAVASRHDVCLIALNQRALLPTDQRVYEAKKVLDGWCMSVDIGRIPWDRSRFSWYGLVAFSLLTRDPYTVNWLKCTWMRRAIAASVRRWKFDAVHLDTISLVEYFPEIGDLPKVLNHHNVESVMMMRRARLEHNLLKKFYFLQEAHKIRRMEMLYGNRVVTNVVVSSLDRSTLSRIVPEARIDICENGTDTGYFQPIWDVTPQSAHLLFVGGMNWYPNRHAIVRFCKEVWPLLIRTVPNVKLTVVGAQPPEEVVQMMARDNRIVVTGFVDDVRPYFRDAEIFICPIRDGGGTRLKILDALAMGKAIVATSVACEGIDVVRGKHVLIADTAEEYVREVKNVIEHPRLRVALERNARELAEAKYSWSNIGRQLVSIYQGIRPSIACLAIVLGPLLS